MVATINLEMETPNQQLKQFFVLTFMISWFLWLPGILITANLISPSDTIISATKFLNNFVAGLGPSFAALYLVFKRDGKAGIKTLLIRTVHFRLGVWYFPTLLFLPFALVLAQTLNVFLFGAAFTKSGLLSEPWWIPVVFVIFIVMVLSEELGWRGYALDRLQHNFSALSSSVILGSIWAAWHLPMFFIVGSGHHDYHLPFLQFLLTLVFASILITWIQNNVKGSLAPALLIHAMINLSGEVLPLIEKNKEIQGDYTAWILVNVILFFMTVIVVSFFGSKKLRCD